MREIFVAMLTEYDNNHGEAFSYLIGCFLTREKRCEYPRDKAILTA